MNTGIKQENRTGEITVRNSYERLKTYCEKQEFKGWDPYDGLNSKVFQALPFVRFNRLFRLAWIQFFKRSSINFRPLFFVPKEYNHKGVGLFLAGYCKEYRLNPTNAAKEKIHQLSQILLTQPTGGFSGACWGYNFDWQARAFFQPRNTPTVVATSFIGDALLDAYEIIKDELLLTTARSACAFILKDLNRTYDEQGNFAFSYSPLDKSVVFNASLLGSRLLARVYGYTKEEELIKAAKSSVQFCCNFQKEDGSWSYGTLPYHHWIDNFHTGYNLECISEYMKYSGDHVYQTHLSHGFRYYMDTFFTEEGISKYYNNAVYPIDVHAPAQLVITLAKLGKFNENRTLVDKVILWTIRNMQSQKGYFSFQKKKHFSSRIPYMRWAQGWMFHALATYLTESST